MAIIAVLFHLLENGKVKDCNSLRDKLKYKEIKGRCFYNIVLWSV